MLPRAPLDAWLRSHVADWPAHWQAHRIAGGQSNPIWCLEADDGRTWVLRARPGRVAELAPGAHAIEREFRVLRALQGGDVPVPQALGLCEDESVIGVGFYVMTHVPGRVLRDSRLPSMTPAERSGLHEDAIGVLAALHGVDWEARGLTGYGRTDAYFERLVARWSRQVADAVQSGAPAVPALARLAEVLPQRIPAGAASWPAVLTHGDFRVENLVIDDQAPRVAAVLDWELSTLGHPLGDLGYYAMAWQLPDGPLRGIGAAAGLPEGIPPLSAVLARYIACSPPGHAPALRQALQDDWAFYLGVQLFRLAAILHGIGQREAKGLSAHPQAAEMGQQAEPVAELAWSVLNG